MMATAKGPVAEVAVSYHPPVGRIEVDARSRGPTQRLARGGACATRPVRKTYLPLSRCNEILAWVLPDSQS